MFIKSMYGRRKAENYFEGINKDEVLFIDQKKSRELASRLRLQLPASLTSLSSNTILRQSKNIVNIKDKDSNARDEARLLQKNMDAYEQARQMYVKALKKASNNYKSGTEYKGAQESLNASAEEVAGKVFGEEQAKLQIEHPEEITEEKIENNFKEIATMKPTLHLNGTEFQTYSKSKELQKDMLKFLMESGDSGEFKNPVIGTITATNAGTKYDISHGIGWIKRLTIAAVPDTLRNGKVVRYSPNWKNRGYDSVLLANKITVDKGEHKGEYYVVAVIHSAPDFSRFVLHEARIEKADLGSMFKSGIRHESSTSATAEYPLIKSIFDKLDEINRQSKKEYTKFQIADEDSEGSELTQEQQEFFNDSKVIDKDGKLMVVYHGSPNGGFTQFKNHLNFFTADKQYAEEYTHKSGASNPQIYEVYLNIKHPFDIRDPKVKKIFDNEYVKGGWAYRIDPSRAGEKMNTNTGLPDWTEADNIYDFLEENEYLDD